ncbi:lytic transglycosylase domain-containing protein [Bombella saccharophila]|uniref:Lytic transglycosylase domain-containing protein n=1 Tax=Bombella saccharophila TaxID=2967338 RepID=A0ABT3W4R3_9PROT|nr:lytic transglycosylase domain-containing protein [Bombella saccharophila]MCX5614050.1 lytic transglycosylase domain-containing protein [Bombella saccharophila]
MVFAMFHSLFFDKTYLLRQWSKLCLVFIFTLPLDAWSQSSSRFEEWRALIAPDGNTYSATRYAAFLSQKPDWPLQKRIESRYEHALLVTTDPQERRTLCPSRPISRTDLLISCAPFLSDVAPQARRLWREQVINPEEAKLFVEHFAPYLTPEDEIIRYTKLEYSGPLEIAKQQIQRTPEEWHSLFYTRLANRFSMPDADELYQANAANPDPTLIYYRLKYLRLHDRLDEATQLWLSKPINTDNILPTPLTAIEWQTEQTNFIRALLRTENPGSAQTSFTILQATPFYQQTAETRTLMGYIALTLLHNPEQARPYFKALSEETDLNKRAEGLYWLARTEEDNSHPHSALEFYKKAREYPTTFYGQLALAHLTHTPFLASNIRSPTFLTALAKELAKQPASPTGHTLARTDLVDACTQLSQDGDVSNATFILAYLQAHTMADHTAQADIARLALSLHIPKIAVLSTRQLTRLGISFYPEGYPPLPLETTTTLPYGLLPALVRQESSMDASAISPRHAIGLTQLLLPTAKQVIRQHQLPYSLITAEALKDPEINLTIGSHYLADMLARFENVIPYTLAAYNAGPTRSQRWQTQMNSPQTPTLDDEDILLRWILLLPFKETRLYIEHIEADLSLYALAPYQKSP